MKKLISLLVLVSIFSGIALAQEKCTLYVWTPVNFDRSLVSRFGTVINEDQNGIVIVTEPNQLIHLNRLPVELCPPPHEGQESFPPLPPPSPAVPVPESLVAEIVARVSADSVLNFIRRLQNFYTRYSTTDSCRAATIWMGEKLRAYGCDSLIWEDFLPGYAPNVIGIKRGRTTPNQIYVICGHIDNTSDYAPNRCPGSDDNASGTAAVLEAARVFQGIEFAASVYFIGFSGEEQGLWGSDSFCARARRRGDSIRAALNFDMISYGRENRDTLNVVGKTSNPNCAWLVDSFIANANAYTTLKTRRRLVSSYPSSDHHSFWQRGYPALLGIERDFTPKYHTIGDTIGPLYFQDCGTNNWLMATEAIKAAVATIAKFAGALPGTGIGERGGGKTKAVLSAYPVVGRPPFKLSPLPTAGVVVFSATGGRVKELPPGRTIWDGTGSAGQPVSPGVYLIRPATGGPGVKVIVAP